MEKNFWSNKKVFITGHTGFKGTWMYLYLYLKKAKLFGYSINYNTNSKIFSKKEYNKSQFFSKIENHNNLKKALKKFDPEIVVHMAAQPLVTESYLTPYKTFITNFIGTLNLLEICRDLKNIKTICIVSSDKVYKEKKKYKKFVESDELLGKDPYSSSKVCVEMLAYSFYESFFKNKNINLFTVRAGNVIGGGDWSKNRLIPDIVRSSKKNKKLLIRNPDHSRPWQHVIDVIFMYSKLIELSYKQKINGSWNVAPDNKKPIKVIDIVKTCKKFIDLEFKIVKLNKNYETKTLFLNNSKIKNKIKYSNNLSITNSLKWTFNWYISKEKSYDKTIFQIKEYMNNYE